MEFLADAGAQVSRRIGGLEKLTIHPAAQQPVSRRIGGLEKQWEDEENGTVVFRRIGGLEIIDNDKDG